MSGLPGSSKAFAKHQDRTSVSPQSWWIFVEWGTSWYIRVFPCFPLHFSEKPIKFDLLRSLSLDESPWVSSSMLFYSWLLPIHTWRCHLPGNDRWSNGSPCPRLPEYIRLLKNNIYAPGGCVYIYIYVVYIYICCIYIYNIYIYITFSVSSSNSNNSTPNLDIRALVMTNIAMENHHAIHG